MLDLHSNAGDASPSDEQAFDASSAAVVAPSYPRVAVAPTKFSEGFGGKDVARSPYEVLELREALERVYKTDAHLVTYTVDGLVYQPRINKPGLADVERAVTTQVFFCDVDNPRHETWSEALLAKSLEQEIQLPGLRTAGIYHTEHGCRIVQPLARPIPVALSEPYLRRWLVSLADAGINVDFACADWTRHFRLPHVVRSGKAYRSPHVSLDRMRPIELEPIVLPPEGGAKENKPSRRRVTVSLPAHIEWSKALPERWQAYVGPIADAVRDVETEWHTLFLALAGALLARKVPVEHVPELCRQISIGTGCDTRTEDRVAAAHTTIERMRCGDRATGYASLAANWPEVAAALEAAFPSAREARLQAQQAASVAALPVPPPASTTHEEQLARTTRALEDCIRNAPEGPTLIAAECGLGKTAATVRVAAERAKKPYASDKAEGKRAPAMSKTSISVDKHALAIQIVSDLRAEGVEARRLFGPLSVLNEDGTPACHYHDVARHLVGGAQSMQWELCLGRNRRQCEYYETCEARKGSEGPENARVTVGPHALVPTLEADAGVTGLLVIDEPPPLLEAVCFSLADLATTQDRLAAFEYEYAGPMAPVVDIVRTWLATGKVDEGGEFGAEILARPTARTESLLLNAPLFGRPPLDAVASVLAAVFPKGQKGTIPPLRFDAVGAARSHVGIAEALGTASRVLNALHDALTRKTKVVARILEVSGERALALTGLAEPMVNALQREGSVVILDANAELHLPVLREVLGYEPHFHRFVAGDGAPIARRLLKCSSATRRGWFAGAQLIVGPPFVSAVRALFAWAKEDASAKSLAIISMKAVELALRAALEPDNADLERQWTEARQAPRQLAAAREALGKIVRSFPGQILFGHYGAVRGLNGMADVDCIASLGDHWPNLGTLENEAAFLGDVDQRDQLAEAKCRAELEQAHGRLRAVHRKRPGRALHVGWVLPSGSGWATNVETTSMPVGRPKGESVMSIDELTGIVAKLGGVSATARALGCSRGILERCFEQQGVTTEMAERLRATSATKSEPHDVPTIDLDALVAELGGVRPAARALACDPGSLGHYLRGSRSMPKAMVDRVATIMLKSKRISAADSEAEV